MTDPGPVGISEAQVRLLVTEARAVLRRIELLPNYAFRAKDRNWAELRASVARSQWQRLLETIREGDAESFDGNIDSVIMNSIPLNDAPPELIPFASTIRILDESLAANMNRIVNPLVYNNRLLPEVYDQLREILPRLAPEFDA
jgi:hypothetical protein